MTDLKLEPKKRSLKDLGGGRRKAVGLSSQTLMEMKPLFDDGDLPLLVEPAMEGVDLLSWAGDHRDLIEEKLLHHGGILFRGFGISKVEQFEDFIRAVSGEMLEYKERSSPRSQVSGNIYTSTDYPPDQPIFLHNENSYQHAWPLKLYFYCHVAPEVGGETPIADTRRVKAAIPAEIRERLEEKGILYIRNFGTGVGLAWQEVFQTDDRSQVEAYCVEAGLQPEWREGGALRTRTVRAATAPHPRTGERLWFNHGTFFHVSTLPQGVREFLLEEFAEDELPSNTYYGDGSPFEPEVMEQLRAAYREATVSFRWQQGDVLLLDNMLTAHARNPYQGPRKVLVGMAQAVRRADL